MTTVHGLTIRIDTTDMVASLRSVVDVLVASRSALECFVDRFPGVFSGGSSGIFELTDDAIDLLFREVIDPPASGAGKLEAIKFNASERYLECVSAIARRINCDVVFSHGWPVLSVGVPSSTVAEAGDGAILPGGGLAA